MKLRPCFINFEGTEAAGKTTVIELLKKRIHEVYDQKYVQTRAPGGTEIGAAIRAILLAPTGAEMSDTTQLLLFAADYRHCIHTCIQPALDRGELVISDRTNVTGWVYQRESKHAQMLFDINADIRTPDIVFIMTTPYSVLRERMYGRSEADQNWRDKVGSKHHEFLVGGYNAYAEKYPEKTVVLDCLRPPEEILEDVIRILEERFSE